MLGKMQNEVASQSINYDNLWLLLYCIYFFDVQHFQIEYGAFIPETLFLEICFSRFRFKFQFLLFGDFLEFIFHSIFSKKAGFSNFDLFPKNDLIYIFQFLNVLKVDLQFPSSISISQVLMLIEEEGDCEIKKIRYYKQYFCIISSPNKLKNSKKGLHRERYFLIKISKTEPNSFLKSWISLLRK